MMFKFKLCRLLAIQIGLMSTGLVTMACTIIDIVTVDEVIQLAIMPREISLLSNETQTFQALGITWANDTVDVAVTWTASGGTITEGSYTASTDPGLYVVVATDDGRGLVDTAAVEIKDFPITAPVASVTVSPSTTNLPVGANAQLTATTLDAAGNVLTGRSISWGSSAPSVAAVNQNGLVSSVGTGTATITATSEGRSGTATVNASNALPLAGFYVAPGGSAAGDGSIGNPWDLSTALAQPSSVIPGQNTTTLLDGAGGTVAATVIWLRGGSYGSTGAVFAPTLSGTATNPVVLRQYPGERSTIDGVWDLTSCPSLWLWGFESFNSETVQLDNNMGFNMRSTGDRLINLVIHDHLGNGVGSWSQASNSEVYGSIIYNNGRQTHHAGYAHGLYIQNTTGAKRIVDNFIFHSLGFDLHGYGSSAAGLVNITIERLVLISAGRGNPGTVWRAGTMANAVFDGVMAHNSVVNFGPTGGDGQDFTFRNGYMGARNLYFKEFSTLTVTDNTIIGFTQMALRIPSASFLPHDYDRNKYWPAGGAPFLVWKNGARDPNRSFSEWQAASGYDANGSQGSGQPPNKVFVHPNLYEPGRANIVAFNWQNLASVSADVSGVLNVGDAYEVRHVFDFYGTPTASGTYGGGTISIPMNTVVPVTPITGWTPDYGAPPTPGPGFGAFVLLRVGTGG